jgi:sarcosine oxidase subunit beta
MPDVLVVGGGLVGLAAAFHLARGGASVTLVEREVCGRHASGLNAGGLRRVNRHPAEQSLASLAQTLWTSLADQLGRDVGYRAVGHLLLAEDEAEMARLSARPHTDFETLLDTAAVRGLCPGIAGHVQGALYASRDGYAHPGMTVAAFRDAAEAAGVRILETCAVTGLEPQGAGWSVVTTAGRIAAGTVVNAAGAAAADLAAMAGERLPVVPQAPIASVTAPLPRFLIPVVQTLTRRLTLKQMPDGRAWIGGGHRADILPRELSVPPTEVAENVATAASLFPVLAGVGPMRSWAAVDGYTPDRVAILGRLAPRGPLHACGFSGHGFQTAPAVGRVIADMVFGIEPAAAVAGLSPCRFQRAPAAEAVP